MSSTGLGYRNSYNNQSLTLNICHILSPSELPIEFLTPLKNLEIYVGDTATFECEINKEKQIAQWYKGGQQIKEDFGDRFTTEVDGAKHRLVIKDGTKEDIGKYKVVIKDAKTSATLGVSGMYQCCTVLLLSLKVMNGNCD